MTAGERESPDPHWAPVGQRLRALRESERLTVADVATAAGVEVRLYELAERGIVADLTVDDLFLIAGALGTDVAGLLEGLR